MPKLSRYVLVVDNISSATPARDIEKEFTYFGRVRDYMKDSKARCALIEFDKSIDCSAAWRKMDGFKMDGRAWKVDYATKDDFKFFGWKWFEDSPSPPRKARSPSPDTPIRNGNGREDDKRPASNSPLRKAYDDEEEGRGRSRSRSPDGRGY